MEQIKIHCAYDRLVPIKDIKLNPKNRNHHPDDQILRLAKIIKSHGMRRPIIVSNRSNTVTCGHGRIMALKHLGVESVPVNFQDYRDEAEEYADAIADNAIAAWSQLDVAGIGSDIVDLPSFDVELLGLKDPVAGLDINFEPGTEDEQGKLDEKSPLVTQCPNCGECFDANKNKPQN